jgi:hypothetical protein
MVGQKEREMRTGFDDTTATAEVEAGDDKGNVGDVEDLSTVWQSKRPKLRSRSEEIDKAFA